MCFCRQEAAELNNPQESISAFLEAFNGTQSQVLASLESIRAKEPSSGNITPIEQLDSVLGTILQLEKTTSEAAYFLPSYDLRQSTSTIQELKQKVEDVRNELVPKKKFSFSKKVNRTKASDLSIEPSTTGGQCAWDSVETREFVFAHLLHHVLQFFLLGSEGSVTSRAVATAHTPQWILNLFHAHQNNAITA